MKKIRWPKPYTKQLTRGQILLALRVYLDDRYDRRHRGFKRGTKGLIPRLAAELGVTTKLITEITEIRGKPEYRERFRDINIKQERENAKRRHLARLARRAAEDGP